MASRRFASRATRDLSLEQLVSPVPELGLVAANGPNDPEPELLVEDGVVSRMDGRDAADFDVIDRFVVAHGLDLAVAPQAMANAALRIDEIVRRPMLVVECAPDAALVVDRNRITDLQIRHGAADIVDVLLERELRCMDADHHQALIAILVGPSPDIGQRAQPVDAGEGPELDEDDLAAQFRRRQRR